MADVEEPQFTTLAERIAALNKQKNFSSSTPALSPSATRSKPSVPQPPMPLVRAATTATSTAGRRPPPPPPPASSMVPIQPSSQALVPRGPARSATVRTTNGHSGPMPQLPPRRPSMISPSQLVPQSPSALDRRPSADSVVSHRSTASSTVSRVSSATSQSRGSASDGVGTRKLPPAFGTTKLPTLPPSRREREAREREEAERRAAAEQEQQEQEWAASDEREQAPALPMRPGDISRQMSSRDDRPPLPPRQPPRPDTYHQHDAEDADTSPLPTRRATVKSTLEVGLNAVRTVSRKYGPQKVPQQVPQQVPQLPRRPGARAANDDGDNDDDGPPPLPMASRPTRAQVDAAVRANRSSMAPPGSGAPGFYPAKSADEECLTCRDFSGPDHVAEQFPLSQLPRRDPVGFLAYHLCDPFPSQTDKARAIFTWCHHNIAYDVDGFFGGCIPRGQTVEDSIFSGKAVCEGYARIYEAIAKAAGLECVVVSGHGKGFGFNIVQPGDPVPPENPTGHAWNAVRIDGGAWKLLDACWGAGNVSKERAERYEKRFAPAMFTMSNEEFGERHFPSDRRYFFRADGRTLSWAEYVVEKRRGPLIQIFSNAPEQFIGADAIEPKTNMLPAARSRAEDDETLAFRFGRPCPHWTPDAASGHDLPPYPMYLQSVVPDGVKTGRRPGEMIDVHYDAPMLFWADVQRRSLGPPENDFVCFAITTVNDRDFRGQTMDKFRRIKGSGQFSYVMAPICAWKVV